MSKQENPWPGVIEAILTKCGVIGTVGLILGIAYPEANCLIVPSGISIIAGAVGAGTAPHTE